jgi:hypothetical protein
MATPEGELKKETAEYLVGAGIFHRRMQSGVIRKGARFIHLCPEGTADYLVFKGAHPIWLELKPKGQKTSKDRQIAQAKFADEVTQLGHTYVRCEALSDVIAALK